MLACCCSREYPIIKPKLDSKYMRWKGLLKASLHVLTAKFQPNELQHSKTINN